VAARVGSPRAGLRGTLAVPGDKSIAHRAVLLGSLAEGISAVHGLPDGADVGSTIAAMRSLGVRIDQQESTARIEGQGLGLGANGRVEIDCGNSGTTMRLGAGLLAGGEGRYVLDGDASLRRRPMERVAAPLRQMGAVVETTDGRAPVTVAGGRLHAIDWATPVASAQLKSAVLLAGLRAKGITRVREPLLSRDHTERLLAHMGGRVTHSAGAVTVEGGRPLRAVEFAIPGDVSSAAFFVVAALLVAGSQVEVLGVGINPTRTGVLDLLRRMGARIEIVNTREVAGETIGDLVVQTQALHATTIGADDIPGAIDELPILCVAAALAKGETTISGAEELRVKESDRLAALEQLTLLGVPVQSRPDGLVIAGSAGRPLRGAAVRTFGDHRIAMAFAIAGLVSAEPVTLDDAECARVSFPGFFSQLRDLGGAVEET